MKTIYRRYKKKNLFERITSLSIVGKIILITSVFSILLFITDYIYFFNCNDCISPDGQVETLPITYDLFYLKPANILQGKYLWTLLTHIFVHGNFLHLFINMFVLFSLGGLSEKIIGGRRFLWFYIISGVFAGILSVILSGIYGNTALGERIFGSPDIFMVGASGAIFAIAGLFVMLLPKLRFMIIFLPFFSLPAYIMVPFVLFITWIAAFAGNFPIGNVAHLGGFLAGLTYGLYLKLKYARKVKILQKMFR